jgi:hypothetical protein
MRSRSALPSSPRWKNAAGPFHCNREVALHGTRDFTSRIDRRRRYRGCRALRAQIDGAGGADRRQVRAALFGNGRLDTIMMMSAIIVLSLMGLALYAVIAVLARVVVYWHSPSET